MHKGLILVLAVVAFLVTTAAASAVSCTLSSCPDPRELVATFGAHVSPSKLPRADYTPIAASVFGKIATTDGTHPSALREVVVDIDKDVKVNVKGYPVCRMRELTGRSAKMALKACRNSLVGEGERISRSALPNRMGSCLRAPSSSSTAAKGAAG